MSRRCLICANINPCREHSEADQSAELARNDAAIARIRGGQPAGHERLRDELAMGQRFWTENWAGSGVEGEGDALRRGSSIWTVDKHGCRGEMIAHFGDQDGTHEAVGKIVLLHNAAMNALLFGSNIGATDVG